MNLFGRVIAYDWFEGSAVEHNFSLMADVALPFGAAYGALNRGGPRNLVTTDLSPAKPRGCSGDGGTGLTNDDDIAAAVRSRRAATARHSVSLPAHVALRQVCVGGERGRTPLPADAR